MFLKRSQHLNMLDSGIGGQSGSKQARTSYVTQTVSSKVVYHEKKSMFKT